MSSAWAMPIIVLNMGGEMVYILHQRLQAQTVNSDKSLKVLQEVVKAMFSPMFIEELFKPQEMYTQASTRQIFEKLAHSSIMRLNKVSMDKLYDLMSMGFKYQIISLKSPQQLIQLTLVHLEKLKEMVNIDVIIEIIDAAIQRLITSYSALKEGDWFILKQSIMRFMQGKRIKVSLFLQQNLQTMNGVLILNNEGVMPYGTEAPGSRKFYDGDKMVHRSDFSSPAALERGHEADTLLDLTSTLGSNMYVVDSCSASKSVLDSLVTANSALSHVPSTNEGNKKSASFRGKTISSSKRELTMLADLLGMGSGQKEDHHDQEKPFKINLFPDSRFDDKDSEGKTDNGSGFIMIDIDGTAGGKSFEEYLQELDLKESKADSKCDDDDDLLALMDSAK